MRRWRGRRRRHTRPAISRDVPALEESGLLVRVPDWWKRTRGSRPQVHVKIGDAAKSRLGADTLLDFHVGVAMGDHELSATELRELMASSDGLVRFRGQWVELDQQKLSAALEHWKRVERETGRDGISFVEGMRLLAGTQLGEQGVEAVSPDVRQWTGIAPGEWLDQTLAELRDPAAAVARRPVSCGAAALPVGGRELAALYDATGTRRLPCRRYGTGRSD